MRLALLSYSLSDLRRALGTTIFRLSKPANLFLLGVPFKTEDEDRRGAAGDEDAEWRMRIL
jgi:hypothetical protein